MAEPSDEALREGLARGRQDAFAALYDRFGARLFRMAFVLLGNRHDAEDAVQSLFLGLARGRGSLGRVTNLWAYLLTSLRHEAGRIATWRVQRREQDLVNPDEFPAHSGSEGNDESLEKALHRLPCEQSQVIRLKYEAELTFAEIAELLDISLNTAASRYRYGIAKLREELKEE